MNGIVNIASNAAISAGKAILQGFSQLERIKIYEKASFDFVSDVDHKSESIIISAIEKAYPEHSIVSEEYGEKSGNEYTWIIDPLDGTNNFIHGFPHFCVSIAVKIGGTLEHGVIYDPILNNLFVASKGKGARLNEHRIRTSNRIKIVNALLATGCPSHDPMVIKEFLASFEQMMEKSSGIRRTGSAALDLAYVASGKLDGFWQSDLKIWDVAAGALLVQEAGGVVFDHNKQGNYLESGNIVAANVKLVDQILSILNR